ncbi:MAG: ParB/RepB/Spo0J family partition protein [Candidatus Jorgensenbacteria bacterium]
MLGKGLESLIPKKDNKASQTFSNSPQSAERPAFFEKSVSEPERARFEAKRESEGERQVGERHAGTRDPVFSKMKPAAQEAIFHIEVEKIQPNPFQPRRAFNQEDLAELAQSIREFGIIQPLVVTKVESETPTGPEGAPLGGTEVSYQLIAGERRLMAAKLIGLPRVPVIVKRFDVHRNKLEVALVENIQRSNLNPIEAARAYARLQDEFNLTQREIAAKIGRSRETVANAVRLLGLPGNIQDALSEGKINESQARLILTSADPVMQNELFEKFLSGKTVARTKSELPKVVDPESKYWEKRLEEKLGNPVEVQRKEGRGRIIVRFHSEAEWRNLLDKVMGSETE